MFLLIRTMNEQEFTKHWNLHSTMFLLIQKTIELLNEVVANLHSTMFLLIRKVVQQISCFTNSFTFHNVSINTLHTMIAVVLCTNLHSTMFLLIRCLTRKLTNKDFLSHEPPVQLVV